jgi:AcrR family transcriptional regulator
MDGQDDPQSPRRRGRPRGFDPDAALDRAIEVFWRRGYAGAGLAELTAAMGISPPSLYAAFGDKRGLFLAALGRYATTVGARPLAALRSAEPGEDAIRVFLDATLALVHDRSDARGCLAACVAADAAGDDPLIRDRLNALLREADAALEMAAGERGPSGRLLLAAMHSLAVRARAGATRAELDDLAADLAAGLGRG